MPFYSRQSSWLSPTLTANFSASGVLSVIPPLADDGISRIRFAKKKEPVIGNTKKLTLNDAVRYALRHNPEILRSIQQIRSIHGKLISTRAQLLPRLIATIALRDAPSSPVPPAFSEVSPADSSPTKLPSRHGVANRLSWNAQLSVQQLIFDGGGKLASMQAVKHQEAMSFFTLCGTIDSVIAQVKTAFFRVILNRTLVAVQERSVAVLENQLENQKRRYQVGTAPRLSVLQAQAATASAASTLVTVQNDLRISQHQLVKLLGMNYAGYAEIPLHVVGDLEVRFHTISPAESVREGLTRNSTLKAQREHVLSQVALVQEVLSGRYPKITLGGGYLIQDNARSYIGGWFCGLNGTWNILGGSGQVRQSKAQLKQSVISYNDNVRSVVASVQKNVANLRQAQEIIRSQQASVVQAMEALRLAREQCDSGIGTQLEVFDAKIKLLQSQAAVLQARFGYIQALAQYESILSLNTLHIEPRDLLTDKEKQRFDRAMVLDKTLPIVQAMRLSEYTP
ncbi:MAG: TolC family protein [Candidatus Xiphinematobacter sp.]|nr:MAG: TolC family protein [Candidatus Xiphinematobacter sp.]QQY10512.1 MAG: TolC family protein [Candidatus Xiphinematobacter sp.]